MITEEKIAYLNTTKHAFLHNHNITLLTLNWSTLFRFNNEYFSVALRVMISFLCILFSYFFILNPIYLFIETQLMLHHLNNKRSMYLSKQNCQLCLRNNICCSNNNNSKSISLELDPYSYLSNIIDFSLSIKDITLNDTSLFNYSTKNIIKRTIKHPKLKNIDVTSYNDIKYESISVV